MHREHLKSQIAEYASRFPEEAGVVERLREFISANANCFDRELEPGHITGSAWLVDLSGRCVLLTHHKKLNGWFQLGGHADGNSDILNVSLTEAQEESGITNITSVSEDIFDIDIHLIPTHKDVPEHYHYDITFAFQVVDSEQYVVSTESHDLAWVNTEKTAEYNPHRSMQRMAHKWRTFI